MRVFIQVKGDCFVMGRGRSCGGIGSLNADGLSFGACGGPEGSPICGQPEFINSIDLPRWRLLSRGAGVALRVVSAAVASLRLEWLAVVTIKGIK